MEINRCQKQVARGQRALETHQQKYHMLYSEMPYILLQLCFRLDIQSQVIFNYLIICVLHFDIVREAQSSFIFGYVREFLLSCSLIFSDLGWIDYDQNIFINVLIRERLRVMKKIYHNVIFCLVRSQLESIIY